MSNSDGQIKTMTDQIEKTGRHLTVREIQIEDFENLSFFRSSFDSRIAVLPPESATAFKKAFGIAIKNRYLCGEKIKINEKTNIKVKAEISGKSYTVIAAGIKEQERFNYTVITAEGRVCDDFFYMIHQNYEEEQLVCFSVKREDGFSEKLKKYKDVERYYSKAEFAELTDGIGNTVLFRRCLNSYIKENSCNDGINNICICENGETKLNSYSHSRESDIFGQMDNAVLLEYLCYIGVNKLWQRIEKIRDFNHIDLPIILIDLQKYVDKAEKLDDYIKRATELNRQIFIC